MSQDQATIRSNRAILDEYAAAKNGRDVGAALALCHEDAWYESVGLGERVEGKDALRRFYTEFFASLPDYRAEFEGASFGSDSATVWGRFLGTSSGRFMGIECEAGRSVEVPVAFVCTFRGGLLLGDRGYFDAATLAAQLGIPLGTRPGPGQADEIPAAVVRRVVADFERLWATKDPAIVGEIVAPDAVAHWSGVGTFRGTEYPERMRVTMEKLVPDIDLRVTGHAANGPYLFISWQARATVGGRQLDWVGTDRFRIRDGLANEVYAIWDTGPMSRAQAHTDQTSQT